MIETITGKEGRRRRIRAGISQTMFGKRYGKSQATISDTERKDELLAKGRFMEALESACVEKFGIYQLDLEDFS